MQLISPRLALRRFRPEDGRALYEYLRLPEVVRYLPTFPATSESCAHLARIRSEMQPERVLPDYLAVTLKASGAMIGHIAFHPVNDRRFRCWELGYIFHPAFCGMGLATEASLAVLNDGFLRYSAHRVIATCDPENVRSWKLMERIGMRREGFFQKCLFLDKPQQGEEPQWRDEYVYGLLYEEWAQRNK